MLVIGIGKQTATKLQCTLGEQDVWESILLLNKCFKQFKIISCSYDILLTYNVQHAIVTICIPILNIS